MDAETIGVVASRRRRAIEGVRPHAAPGCSDRMRSTEARESTAQPRRVGLVNRHAMPVRPSRDDIEQRRPGLFVAAAGAVPAWGGARRWSAWAVAGPGSAGGSCRVDRARVPLRRPSGGSVISRAAPAGAVISRGGSSCPSAPPEPRVRYVFDRPRGAPWRPCSSSCRQRPLGSFVVPAAARRSRGSRAGSSAGGRPRVAVRVRSQSWSGSSAGRRGPSAPALERRRAASRGVAAAGSGLGSVASVAAPPRAARARRPNPFPPPAARLVAVAARWFRPLAAPGAPARLGAGGRLSRRRFRRVAPGARGPPPVCRGVACLVVSFRHLYRLPG